MTNPVALHSSFESDFVLFFTTHSTNIIVSFVASHTSEGVDGVDKDYQDYQRSANGLAPRPYDTLARPLPDSKNRSGQANRPLGAFYYLITDAVYTAKNSSVKWTPALPSSLYFPTISREIPAKFIFCQANSFKECYNNV